MGPDITSYDLKEVVVKILEELKKAQNNLTHLNVMVLGKTGSGKSTLINNIFREPLAVTGIGKPITQSIRKYEKEGVPLSIYDTPGLELGGEHAIKMILDEVTQVMSDGIKSGNISNAIHCIWYCVSSSSHRFEQAEKEFIERFLSETSKYNIPVILVLTQSFSKKDMKELKSAIEKEDLPIAQIVPVLAEDYTIDEDYTVKSFGLDQLTEVTDTVIPEAVKNTLAAVQKASIKLKSNKAHAIVASAAAGAAATGAIPIPVSDAFLLIPEQVSMLAGITAVFGLPVEKSTITAVVSSTIGTTGATVLGKTVVSSILKCIPGAGSIAGGAISGSIAAALTAALGEAYIGIMVLICNGEMKVSDLETNTGKEMLAKLFKEKLSLKRDKKGNVKVAEE